MGKVIGTTIVRLIIVVVFGFYLKFIDNDMAGYVSGRLTNQEQVAMSGEIQDPVLSGVVDLGVKIDSMSGLNTQIEENAKMLKLISEKLGISTVVVATGATNAIIATGTTTASTGNK